jgi:hypothetical protein
VTRAPDLLGVGGVREEEEADVEGGYFAEGSRFGLPGAEIF